MANNAILSSIYNQYLTTYAPTKADSRYDTHKRSELKSIYNSLVRVNRDAPLYKIDNSDESRQYIIGLKEESRVLHNNIVSAMGYANSTDLNSKVAFSSDEDVISAKYIGDSTPALPDGEQENEASTPIPSYNIEVTSLASPQVNLGLYLPKDEMQLTPGDYSFDVIVNKQGYEFQYSVREDDTNLSLQQRLSRLINNSGINLKSEVIEDNEGNSALRIESTQVGVRDDEARNVFSISDTDKSSASGSVAYLGIDYVAREATNAHLVIDGSEVTSSSNTFILNNMYEISLNGISPNEGQSVAIGVKPDTEAAIENISNLIGSYNNFIKTMSEYNESQSRNAGLIGEMNNIARVYGEQLGNVGIHLTEDGTLDIDKSSLNKAISSENGMNNLSTLKDFSNVVLHKSDQIALNPVSYMNKTVVAYKSPGRNFTSPYTASAYSGMMFNSYC